MKPKSERPATLLALALAAAVALAALLAGCGGGGGGGGGTSESPAAEAALVKKFEAGATKYRRAQGVRVSLDIHAEVDGDERSLGCLTVADQHSKPERFDLRFSETGCTGKPEHELRAIGREAWVTREPHGWQPARITEAMIRQAQTERTEVAPVLAGAEEIEEDPESGSVEEGGKTVTVPSYKFKTPASAIPGAAPDVAGVTIEAEAVLDRQGYLRELNLHGSSEGSTVDDTSTFELIEGNLGIEPPPASKVSGPTEQIETPEDLQAIFDYPFH
jgi:hypothetical protein